MIKQEVKRDRDIVVDTRAERRAGEGELDRALCRHIAQEATVELAVLPNPNQYTPPISGGFRRHRCPGYTTYRTRFRIPLEHLKDAGADDARQSLCIKSAAGELADGWQRHGDHVVARVRLRRGRRFGMRPPPACFA